MKCLIFSEIEKYSSAKFFRYTVCTIKMSGVVQWPSQRAASSRKALLEGREVLPENWVRLGDPPGGPGVVGRLYGRAGRGREALTEGRE